MSSYNRPTLSPTEPQASQFSLHTPVDAQPPDDRQYQSGHSQYSSDPYHPNASYTSTPPPQGTQHQPPPVSHYSPVHYQHQTGSPPPPPNMNASQQQHHVPSPKNSPPGSPGLPHQEHSESYQMTPQPARSPPPTFEYSQMSHPQNSTSPPPAFDPHAPAPAQFQQHPPQPQEFAREGPQDYATPPHHEYPPPPQQFPPPPTQEFPPPPTQEFPPPPQDPNHYPPPPSQDGRPPIPPEPIHTPGYNASESTGPLTPKTPIYTPGGAAGPNGGIHAPGQIGHPNQQHSREPYKHGMCNCFGDMGTCCTGYWCPCILYSRTQHRLKTSPNSNLNGFSSLNGHCALFCVAAPVSWVLTMLQRTRIRENYRLEGSVASDCMKAYCCVMCTLVQDDREVAHREDEKRKFAGPGSGLVGDGGYRRASGMVYG